MPSYWVVRKRTLHQLEQRVRDRQRAPRIFTRKYPPRQVLMDNEGHVFASPSVIHTLKNEFTADIYSQFLTRNLFEMPNMTPWGKVIPDA